MFIYLIRHGETAGNAEGVVQMPEAPLSERGLEQAERLGARLAEAGIGQILASDYARAEMTAEALQRATDSPLEIHELLRERNYGDLRGRPYTEVGQYIMMEGYEPPNGESWEVFHERVDRAWDCVRGAAARAQGSLAVVTHGLVCRSLFRHLQLPASADPPERFGNTSVTVIEAAKPWRASVLACTAHLDDGPSDDPTAPSGI